MGKATAAKTKPVQAPDPASRLHKGDVAPTDEWLARYDHSVHSIKSQPGVQPGLAYMRRPWYLSLIDRDWVDARKHGRDAIFTIADRKALTLYRESAEASERSETKCSLASMIPQHGGKSDGPSDSILRARDHVRWAESLMGPFAATVRSVAIDDLPYAQVAMQRFGARDVEWYDDETGTMTKRPSPRSGRHTARIREEFIAGVRRLTAAGRVSLPAVARETVSNDAESPSARPISDAICLALLSKQGVAIAVSLTVAQAIIRENGGKEMFGFEAREFDPDTHELEFGGLPVTVKDWAEGAWMVVEAGA